MCAFDICLYLSIYLSIHLQHGAIIILRMLSRYGGDDIFLVLGETFHTIPPPLTSQGTSKNTDSLNTENSQNWQDPLQQLHSLPDSCFTCKVWHYHGTSAFLEPKQRFCQSKPLCAFLNSSCEYLSFNWAAILYLVGLLYCGALQCNPTKNNICNNTKGSSSAASSSSASSFSISSRFQSFNIKLGMLATQTAQFLTEFSQIYLIDDSV